MGSREKRSDRPISKSLHVQYWRKLIKSTSSNAKTSTTSLARMLGWRTTSCPAMFNNNTVRQNFRNFLLISLFYGNWWGEYGYISLAYLVFRNIYKTGIQHFPQEKGQCAFFFWLFFFTLWMWCLADLMFKLHFQICDDML